MILENKSVSKNISDCSAKSEVQNPKILWTQKSDVFRFQTLANKRAIDMNGKMENTYGV